MSKTFRQYDSRWGRLSYPPGTRSTMASAGCGPTACASIIVNNPKYRNITPKTTRKFMLKGGYVPGGVGTMWSGIDACMKHFGFEVKRHNDMDSFFKEMNKGNRRAIILFGAGSRGGITWTSGGHYVPATMYKKKNGKHYLYTRDPGGRRNDGWHCYETQMKGLIKCIWTCRLLKTSSNGKKYTGTFPKLPARGYFKKGDSGMQVKYLQKLLNWALGTSLKADGSCGTKTISAVIDFQLKYNLKDDGMFGKKCLAKAKTIKK